MGRHTIGDKRGSVRGAPPDVYIQFGSCVDEDETEHFRPILDYISGGFKIVLTGLVAFALVFLYWLFFLEPGE